MMLYPLERKTAARVALVAIVLSLLACASPPPDGTREGLEELEGMLARPCDDGGDGECLELRDDALVLARVTPGVGQVRVLEPTVLDVELAPGSVGADRLQVGTPVFRPRLEAGERPLTGIVSAITPTEGGVRVTLEPAGVRDVFARGRIRRRYAIDMARAHRGEPDASRRLAMDEEPPGGDVGASSEALGEITTDCNDDSLDPMYDRGGVRFGVDRCEFGFDAVADYDIRWGGLRPDHAIVTLTGTFRSALHGYFELDAEYDETDEWRLGPEIQIPVGTLPLDITLSLMAGYELSAAASIEAEAGFEMETSLTTGLEWNRGDGVDLIWRPSHHFEALGPSLTAEGSVHARVYLRPQIGLEAFELIDGWIGVQLYSDLDVELNARVRDPDDELDGSAARLCHDLSVGLVPEIGGSIGALGITFWSDSVELESGRLERSISNDCVVVSQRENSSCSQRDDECAFGSDCTGLSAYAERRACMTAGCADDCTCTLIEIEGCCVDDSECGGRGGLAGSCVNNECVYVSESYESLGGVTRWLCTRDSQCDDGQAATNDSCEDGECVHEVPVSMSRTPIGELYECARDSECDDGRGRTADRCVGGSCTHDAEDVTITADPCALLSCSDGDAATLDSCVDGECRHLVILGER